MPKQCIPSDSRVEFRTVVTAVPPPNPREELSLYTHLDVYKRQGLYHIGLKIGDTDDDLREAATRLAELGVPILGASDHTISHSLYLRDPDGNDVELFIDVAGVDWKSDPSLIAAPVKPLAL